MPQSTIDIHDRKQMQTLWHYKSMRKITYLPEQSNQHQFQNFVNFIKKLSLKVNIKDTLANEFLAKY